MFVKARTAVHKSIVIPSWISSIGAECAESNGGMFETKCLESMCAVRLRGSEAG